MIYYDTNSYRVHTMGVHGVHTMGVHGTHNGYTGYIQGVHDTDDRLHVMTLIMNARGN